MCKSQYRKSPRAAFLDYNSGMFFVTICTKDMKCYFGEISEGEMHLSAIGAFVSEQLGRASEFNSTFDVVLYVVMPNHIHAIVALNDNDIYYEDPYMQQRAVNPSERGNGYEKRHVMLLSRYVNSLKGTVTKYARSIGSDFMWHGRYYDHMIRGNEDAMNITNYILNNVYMWNEDEYYS